MEDQLIEASKTGNLEKVKECIQAGVNVHALDDVYLRLASFKGHLEIVKYFVEEAGADVHANNDKALQQASCNGHLEVVKYLIEEAEADIHAENDGALRWASRNGHLEIVKYLLLRGANHRIYDNPHFQWFCNGSQYKIIKYLWESGFSYFKDYPTLKDYLPVSPRKRFLL